MFEKAKFDWYTLPTSYRFYIFGIISFCIGYVNRLTLQRSQSAVNLLLPISYILFGLGFSLWLFPCLKNIWKSTFGKVMLAILHALILLFTVKPSRFFVSNALGLPPQDFEITVGLFALLLYPALWVLLMAIMMGIISLIFMLLGFVCRMTDNLILNNLFVMFSKLFPIQSKIRSFLITGRREFASWSFLHAMGAIVISLAMAHIWDLNANALLKMPTLIKWVAYSADFQAANRYPGIDKNKRFRLHENGIVSYAERNGWDINITVGKIHE